MQDLVAGHVDWMISGPSDAVPQMRLGNIKAYASMAKTRLTSAPDVPTVDEAGLPGLYFSNWVGIWAPRGTPKAIVDKLNAALHAHQEKARASRVDPIGSTRPDRPACAWQCKATSGKRRRRQRQKVLQNARLPERISFSSRRRYAARADRLSHHDFNFAHSSVILDPPHQRPPCPDS
jgi:Tripartite tricarboxylate transporter family receptor